MLLRDTLRYLPSQLLAPLVQLASVVVWTHWLAPEAMALFTLVTVAQEIAYALALGWFSVYALRYLPAASDRPARRRYLDAENAVVLASLAIGLLAACVVMTTLPAGTASAARIGIVGVYFITRALNLHYAERARAQQAFLAYGLLQSVGPVGGMALGMLALEWVDADPWWLLSAYATAQALGTLLALPLIGVRLRLARPDPGLLRSAIGFGLPAFGVAMVAWWAENGIRYLVEWRAGAAALGMLVVGWSLGRRCASVASMLVVTAAFPLAARLLNEGRRTEALVQLRANAALVLAVLAPAVAALTLLGPALITSTVAASYQAVTLQILGLAVLGSALRNLRVHTVDQILLLDRCWWRTATVSVIEIVVCTAGVLGGLAWRGLPGAVAGQAFGSLLALGIGVYWAHRHCGLSWPVADSARVLLATAAMVAVLALFGPWQRLAGVALGAAVGGVVYAGVLAMLHAPRLLRLREAAQALKAASAHQDAHSR